MSRGASAGALQHTESGIAQVGSAPVSTLGAVCLMRWLGMWQPVCRCAQLGSALSGVSTFCLMHWLGMWQPVWR